MILIPVFLSAILLLAFILQEWNYRNQPYKKYLLPALAFKLLSALAFCSIYVFYYKGGDTTGYYVNASRFYPLFWEHPLLAFQALFSEFSPFQTTVYDLHEHLQNARYGPLFMVIKTAAVVNLFGFNSFWLTTVLFAALSFTGLWALYRVLIDMYPDMPGKMAIAVFFVPSVVFWGSGILKDTITIGALGWLVYGFYHLVIKKDSFLSSALIIIGALYLINELKGYILIAVLPSLVIWGIAYHQTLVKDWRLKLVGWISGMSFLFLILFLKRHDLQPMSQLLLEVFVSRALDFHNWHGLLAATQGGSGYSLGEIEFTWLGILSKLPVSVNVALFRPYLFEVHNPVMLMAAIESTALMLMTIYVLLRTGIFRTFGIAMRHPEILFCLFFAISFAFAVGFTSYNFGALVRYKIPCLPFYVAALFMILHRHRQESLALQKIV